MLNVIYQIKIREIERTKDKCKTVVKAGDIMSSYDSSAIQIHLINRRRALTKEDTGKYIDCSCYQNNLFIPRSQEAHLEVQIIALPLGVASIQQTSQVVN